MKVILLKSIDGVGEKYAVKDVKNGYWRNFLFPKSLAKEATPVALKQLEKLKQQELESLKKAEEKPDKNVELLKDKVLIVELKADKDGNLFAGLGAKKIAKYIKDKLDLDINPEFINIEKPIKSTGSYEIPVKNTVLKLEIKPQQ